MSVSIKQVRNHLIVRGIGMTSAQPFIDRCNSLWGAGWTLGDQGVVAGGAVVVRVAEYGAFVSGLPYGKVFVPPSAKVDDEDTPEEEPEATPPKSREREESRKSHTKKHR